MSLIIYVCVFVFELEKTFRKFVLIQAHAITHCIHGNFSAIEINCMAYQSTELCAYDSYRNPTPTSHRPENIECTLAIK